MKTHTDQIMNAEIITKHINTIIRDGMRSHAARECLVNRITTRRLPNESPEYVALVAVNADIDRACAQLDAVRALATDILGSNVVEEIESKANEDWQPMEQHLTHGLTLHGVEVDLRDLP